MQKTLFALLVAVSSIIGWQAIQAYKGKDYDELPMFGGIRDLLNPKNAAEPDPRDVSRAVNLVGVRHTQPRNLFVSPYNQESYTAAGWSMQHSTGMDHPYVSGPIFTQIPYAPIRTMHPESHGHTRPSSQAMLYPELGIATEPQPIYAPQQHSSQQPIVQAPVTLPPTYQQEPGLRIPVLAPATQSPQGITQNTIPNPANNTQSHPSYQPSPVQPGVVQPGTTSGPYSIAGNPAATAGQPLASTNTSASNPSAATNPLLGVIPSLGLPPSLNGTNPVTQPVQNPPTTQPTAPSYRSPYSVDTAGNNTSAQPQGVPSTAGSGATNPFDQQPGLLPTRQEIPSVPSLPPAGSQIPATTTAGGVDSRTITTGQDPNLRPLQSSDPMSRQPVAVADNGPYGLGRNTQPSTANGNTVGAASTNVYGLPGSNPAIGYNGQPTGSSPTAGRQPSGYSPTATPGLSIPTTPGGIEPPRIPTIPGAAPTVPGATWPNQPPSTLPVSMNGGANYQPQVTTGRIKIASFNIQVFGESKIGQPDAMRVIIDILQHYDLIAIQEIRTQRDDFLPRVIQQLNAGGRRYDFVIGPRLGRTNSTEQYAYIFDTATIDCDRSTVYTAPDPRDLLHREPLVAGFRARTANPQTAFTFTLINIHTDPDETIRQELPALVDVVHQVRNDGRGEDDIILLGDLNAGGNQLAGLLQSAQVQALIINQPTNTRGDREYDNILLNPQATLEFTGQAGAMNFTREFGMDLQQALRVSDHLPVWAEFTAIEGGAAAEMVQRNGGYGR